MISDARLLALKEGGMSYKQIADQENLNRDSVRGRISRARRKQQSPAAAPPTAAPLTLAMLMALYRQAAAPAQLPDPESDREHDRDDWYAVEARLRTLKRLAKVLILGDIHFPDHDPAALKLASAIALWLQPDVIVLNGDTFDFSELSSFAQHWKDERKDAFRTVREAYTAFVDDLAGTCSATAILHMDGNHNARLYRQLAEHPQFADTLALDYRALVRAGGKVLYMGELQELDLGDVIIQHGTKTEQNVAKKALEALGGAHSQVQSHTHLPELLFRRVKRRGDWPVVTSAVTPCLCRINPRYRERETKQSKWIQGVTLLHVNMSGGAELVNAQQVIFHPQGRKRIAVIGKQYFEAEEA